MERRIPLRETGVTIITVLACIAAWLAVPQTQAFLAAPLQQVIAITAVGIVVALTILLALALIRWRARRFERMYLRALAERLRWINGLLLGGGRDESGTALAIQEAFCPLTLDRAVLEAQIEPPPTPHSEPSRVGGLLGLRDAPADRVLLPPSRSQRMVAGLLAGAVQASLFTWWLVFIRSADWSGETGWRWLLARSHLQIVLASVLWLTIAVLAQCALLPLLRRRWDRQRTCSARPGTPGHAICSSQRLLLQGSPGCGKTTLLRHMARRCTSKVRAAESVTPRIHIQGNSYI